MATPAPHDPPNTAEPITGYVVAEALDDVLEELRALTKGGMAGMRPQTIARYEHATNILRALHHANARRPGWTLPA